MGKNKLFDKKLVYLALSVFISNLAFATEPMIRARSFKGYSTYTKASPTECTYSLGTQKTWDGRTVAKVYLNTDQTSLINYAIEIPLEHLPLQEGYALQPYNNVTISYNNGVLTSKEVRGDQGYYGGHIIETVEIPVSPDLLVPQGIATADSIYKSLTHPIGQTDQSLECEF